MDGFSAFRRFFKVTSNVLVLDGALATELETRGCDLDDSLWSGRILLEQPDIIQAVEASYLEAGARCLITASYQVTPQALQKQRGLSEKEAVATVAKSVELAVAARAARATLVPSAPTVFVAGSVGPYGAYLANGSEYRGDYVLTEVALKDFHRPRLAALVAAGVDVLALETQPSAAEVKALIHLLAEEFSHAAAWVSFTSSPAHPHTQLADGTPFADIVPFLDAAPQVVAIGLNCVPLATVSASLKELSKYTRKPLVVYPNSGESYDAASKTWSGRTDDDCTLAGHCVEWLQSGARIIGGCCRTGPKDIASLAVKIATWGGT